jgi:hypothetical protein
MCEKAEEIHKNHEFTDGDFLFDTRTPTVKFVIYLKVLDDYLSKNLPNDMEKAYESEFMIWLPRQDQLQEMAGNPLEVLSRKLLFQNEFTRHLITEEYEKSDYVFKSFEQLWLEIVMFEKHKKIWNGEKWIKKLEMEARVTADFCLDCNKEIFSLDFSDFEGMCLPGETIQVLCEGCGGMITVDHEGKKVDGKE